MGAQASHEPLEQNVARHDQPTVPVGAPELPPGSFTRRLSIRRSKKKRKADRSAGDPPQVSVPDGGDPTAGQSATGGTSGSGGGGQEERRRPRRMDRLRRSLRDSFRRKKEHLPESSRPHQWQADELAVRNGNCSFHVKYLGCVQVYESRGMQVCEDAIKLLRSQRRRPLRGVLYVTGDGLRVVDDDTKDLIVDQTIEKVSFCAPDRNHERGFSYICRDGTTRRWMCHGFLAIRESGERLSHAVGCAFAVCLERKQKRDKECSVTMTVDPTTSSFTRFGSFRQASITERLTDPQECKPAEPVPVKPVSNPFAVERPHAPVGMFERQGSLRVTTGKLSGASPFKRQYSLRLDELPSTLERQGRPAGSNFSGSTVAPIPEAPIGENEDSENVTLLCQELSHGLDLLSGSQQTSAPAPHNPPRPDEWLSSLTNGGVSSGRPAPSASPAPLITDTAVTAHSDVSSSSGSSLGGPGWKSDPFGAEWTQIAERNNQANRATNPFLSGGTAVKAFEVQM